MKKKNDLERSLITEELTTLQSFITQSVERIYAHKNDYKHYNNQDLVISFSFKPKMLVKFSNGCFLFRNDAILNQFKEFVHKIAFDAYHLKDISATCEYDEILESNFFIDFIEIYSTSNEAYLTDYSEISDTLIILVSHTGKKIAFVADEEFQDSILFWYNTETIELKLLCQTLNDTVTPKFHKRIEISRDKIEYLW